MIYTLEQRHTEGLWNLKEYILALSNHMTIILVKYRLENNLVCFVLKQTK